MKTKHKDKKSMMVVGAAFVAVPGQPSVSRTIAPTKPDERTENVYENKAQVQKVKESRGLRSQEIGHFISEVKSDSWRLRAESRIPRGPTRGNHGLR